MCFAFFFFCPYKNVVAPEVQNPFQPMILINLMKLLFFVFGLFRSFSTSLHESQNFIEKKLQNN